MKLFPQTPVAFIIAIQIVLVVYIAGCGRGGMGDAFVRKKDFLGLSAQQLRYPLGMILIHSLHTSIVMFFTSLLSVVWDDKAVEKLLDRSQVTEVPDQDNEDEEKGGMNEYLRSFKVASYQIKTTAEEVGTQSDVYRYRY